jgi:hypothetical protein
MSSRKVSVKPRKDAKCKRPWANSKSAMDAGVASRRSKANSRPLMSSRSSMAAKRWALSG